MIQCLSFLIFYFLYYRFFSRNHDYWKKRNVPYVKPLPVFGSSLDMIKKPLFMLDLQRYCRFGPIYGYFEGSRPIISVGDPELLKGILDWNKNNFTNRRELKTGDIVIDNMVSIKRGKDWKRIRNLMVKVFTISKIRQMTENVFQDRIVTLINNFRIAAENEIAVDLKRIYGAFTMDVIATAAFSFRTERYNNPDNILTRLADSILNKKLKFKLIFHHLLPVWVMRMLRIDLSSMEDTAELRRISLEIIQERKRTGEKKDDFLQLLLDNSETENTSETSDRHLSVDELVSQCAVFFLAGYETTASALSLTTYLLALNQEVQQRLRAEVDAEMERNDDHLTYDAVNSLVYLDRVISEALRLYPPAFRLERQADADYHLGYKGIIIRKGMIITIPVYAMHRDPKFWPNPERFDPERFSPEEVEKRPKYCYLPFGAGSRMCIGHQFARTETKLSLAYVVRHFKINPCPETKAPLEFDLSQHSLLQPKDIKVSLEPRHL